MIYIHFSDIKLKFFKNQVSYPKFGKISSNLSNTGVRVYHVIMLSAWSLVFDKAILTINKIMFIHPLNKNRMPFMYVCAVPRISR